MSVFAFQMISLETSPRDRIIRVNEVNILKAFNGYCQITFHKA